MNTFPLPDGTLLSERLKTAKTGDDILVHDCSSVNIMKGGVIDWYGGFYGVAIRVNGNIFINNTFITDNAAHWYPHPQGIVQVYDKEIIINGKTEISLAECSTPMSIGGGPFSFGSDMYLCKWGVLSKTKEGLFLDGKLYFEGDDYSFSVVSTGIVIVNKRNVFLRNKKVVTLPKKCSIFSSHPQGVLTKRNRSLYLNNEEPVFTGEMPGQNHYWNHPKGIVTVSAWTARISKLRYMLNGKTLLLEDEFSSSALPHDQGAYIRARNDDMYINKTKFIAKEEWRDCPISKSQCPYGALILRDNKIYLRVYKEYLTEDLYTPLQ